MLKRKSFMVVLLLTILIISTMLSGCKKNKDLKMAAPLDFSQNEAMRYAGVSVDMGTFLLFAVDMVPYFESAYGKDCWSQEEIDLTWAQADPQSAYILYVADGVLSAIAMDKYYDTNYGELSEEEKDACLQAAHTTYEAFSAAISAETSQKNGVSEATYYQYETMLYKTSRVLDEIKAEYDSDSSTASAVLAMRDALDPAFDYYNAINWDLVEKVNYGEYGL